jgi:outer membrane protein assembly complex protein YaeT
VRLSPRKVLRWRTLVVLSACFIILVILVLAAVQTPWVRRWALRKVEAYAERKYGLELTAESLAYNPLSLSFSLINATLRTTTPRLSVEVQADALAGRVPLSFILGKGVRVSRLTISRPRVRAVERPAATSGPRPARPAASSSPSKARLPAFIIDSAALREGSLVFSDPGRRLELRLSGIAIDIKYLGEGLHSVRLETGDADSLEAGRFLVPFGGLSLTAEMSRDGARLEGLALQVGSSRLRLSGSLEDFYAPQIRADIEGVIEGETLRTVLRLGESVEGRMDLRAKVSGALPALTAEASLTAKGVGYASWRGAEIEAAFAWGDGSLRVPQFRVSSPYGNLAGHVELLKGQGPANNSAEVAWDSLELARLADVGRLPISVSSRARGHAGGRWGESLRSSLRGQAELELTPAPGDAAGGRRSISLSGRLSADVRPAAAAAANPASELRLSGRLSDAAGRQVDIDARAILDRLSLNLAALSLSIPGGKVTASGRLPTRSGAAPMALTLRAENVDLEKAAGFLSLPYPVAGILSIEAAASGTLPEPDISLRISAANLTYKRIELGGATFTGKTVGSSLDFRLAVPGFSVSAQGLLGLKSPYDLTGTISISRLTMGSLSGLLPSSAPSEITASLDGTVHISAALARPAETLRADAEFRDMTFGLPGKVLTSRGTARLAFDRNALVVDNLNLAGPGGSVDIHGTIPVIPAESARLTVEADIDLGLLDLAEEEIKAAGRLTVSGAVGGGLSSPVVNLRAEVRDGRLEWPRLGLPLTALQMALEVKANSAALESASFRFGRAEAALSGRFPLGAILPRFKGGASGVAFQGAVENLDLAELGPALSLGGLEKMAGTANLGFKVHGQSFDWRTITGDIEIGSLRLTSGRLSLALSETARLDLTRGLAEIRSLKLSGEDTQLGVSGAIDLVKKEFAGVVVRGAVELALLRPFLSEAEIAGKTDLEIHVGGGLDDPRLEGTLAIRDGRLNWPSLDVSLSGMNGRVTFDKSRALIQDVRGTLNHGTLEASGEIDWTGLKLDRADIRIAGSNILTNYPRGFLAEWNVSLGFTSDGRRQKLGGKVMMIQGEYTQDFDFRSGLFSLLKRGSPTFYAERSPFLEKLDFAIDIVTVNPFVVRNSLVNAELRGALRLGGTPYSPGLGGSVLFLEGGSLTLGGNTYQVEQGRVAFVNPNRIEPDLNLRITTMVSGYEVRLIVSGTPARLSAGLTSDPPLPEPAIISLLATGVPQQSGAAATSSALANQAVGYLEQAVTGQVGRTIARGLGLESLNIDTSLVAPQESPEARITVGQHLAPNLQLILSQDMRNSNVRTIILNYRPLRELNLQALNQDNNEFRLSSQGELRFGPTTQAAGATNLSASRKRLRLGRLTLEGELGFPEKKVRGHLSLKEGREFNFLDYSKALQKLRDFYARADYLDATVDAIRENRDGFVDVAVRAEAGRPVEFRTVGISLPRSVRRAIRQAWADEIFDAMKPEETARRVRDYLCSKRYYRASVKAEVKESAASRRLVMITAVPGPRFDKPKLIFVGNRSLSASELRRAVDPESVCLRAGAAKSDTSRNLREIYRENGYLEARVEGPAVEYGQDEKTVRAVFTVEEGPRFLIRSIEFEGNRFFDRARLLKISGLSDGEVFRPKSFDRSKSSLQAAYEAQGFIDATVDAAVSLQPERAAADVKFTIQESFQAVIENVGISGTRLTRPSFVRNVLSFRPGDLVDVRKVNESRRDLYDLGVFSTLSIDLAPLEESRNPAGTASGDRPPRRPYAARVEVSEAKPFTLIGGLQYDTETSLGGNAALVHDNLFGRAISLGGSAIVDGRQQVGRVFLRGQYFLGKRIDSNLSAFYDHSIEPSFSLRRRGVTLQQQIKFRERYVLSYDYTFERDSVASSDTSLDRTDNLGRVSLSLAYDSRDSFFNPTRGRFASGTFECGARFLGSDFGYARFLGQAYFYLRLAPRLLFASAVRLGLEKGFGLSLPVDLRFFTGGGSTVRGYGYHEIGPRDPATGAFVGGEALLVLNEELRFPVYKLIGAAVFLDLGNVYRSASEFSPLRLRSGAGFGLRLDAGLLVGRLDIGFKLNRRSGESASRVYFSIGQMF